ncbi:MULTISPECIES: DUF1330 domain-containing protein [unclassified Roseitalea]|uniref:DUF1330 domain-containing protein n=1 Tax=unclassified Roseitalea TaxID=2639107 RepID=UPI00273F663D|nr:MULTISPECIES: DUF1330 domain-containing protein [unclassified Roseitalea]
MAKGYWIARLNVHDSARYPEYIEAAAPAYAEYGARFLVRGGAVGASEGDVRQRNVVIEFPTYEAALACYNSDSYAKARAIRQELAEGEIIVVEGVDG